MMAPMKDNTKTTVKAGKAKALAVVGPTQRSPILPDVPTWSEAGMELNIATWFGLFAPAATPAEVVRKVYDDTARSLAAPKMRELLASLQPGIFEKDLAPLGRRVERLLAETGVTPAWA